MLVLGIGLGLVMQVLVLAVQNAVDPQDLGVATSAATFFRSIGGSFGVAIFGAIFANRLGYWLPRLVAQKALAHGSASSLVHASPARLRALPPAVHTGLVEAISRSLHSVFVWAIPFGVVAFVIALLLREVPLRESQPVGTAAGEDFGLPVTEEAA